MNPERPRRVGKLIVELWRMDGFCSGNDERFKSCVSTCHSWLVVLCWQVMEPLRQKPWRGDRLLRLQSDPLFPAGALWFLFSYQDTVGCFISLLPGLEADTVTVLSTLGQPESPESCAKINSSSNCFCQLFGHNNTHVSHTGEHPKGTGSKFRG